MSTGFSIEIGYISGYTCEYDEPEAFLKLAAIIDQLRNENSELWQADDKPDVPSEYIEIYGAKHGNPVSVIGRDSVIVEATRNIFISCSGGNPGRTYKELVAMFVCRIIQREMHKLGIPVTITVS